MIYGGAGYVTRTAEESADVTKKWSAMQRQTKKDENLTLINSVALSPQANYTDWATATCRRNLVSTSTDRGVSRCQSGGSPTVVNLSILDRKLNIYRNIKGQIVLGIN
jgi:hypothetical protein